MPTRLADLFETASSSDVAPPSKHTAHDEEFPETPYAICLTPRSGSTYLTYLLKETGKFGFPDEWLNAFKIKDEVASLGTSNIALFLRRILIKHASENGVSGLEFSYSQLLAAQKIGNLDKTLTGRMRYFYLRRRNIVRQAISLYTAFQSGLLHSNDSNDEKRAAHAQVNYNRKAIRENINILHDQEMGWETYFGSLRIEPDRLYYEDLIARPDKVLRRMSNILGLDVTPLPSRDSAIKPISDHRNEEWEARFRDEEADYLKTHAKYRPFTHIRAQET
jgi:LPS sulfotransferase NodH